MATYLTFLDNTAIRIGVILIFFSIAKMLIRPLTRKLLHISRTKPKLIQEKRLLTAMGFINSVATIVLWIFAIILILAQFHINLVTLLTGAGIVGVLLGFGFQSVIKSFMTSFSLLMSGFYEVGDRVTIADVTGVVQEINLKNTILEDERGAIHFVPNSEIKVITNLSRRKK